MTYNIPVNKKLVLFDIDGTLIYHVGPRKWEEQYAHGMQSVYGITGPQNYMSFNGSIEMHMAWEIARKYGIKRTEFTVKFPDYIQAMIEHLNMWEKKGPVFRIIPDAVALVQKLTGMKDMVLGVLTGNAKQIARWKLTHTGLSEYFTFGLYGDEADDRIQLAGLVFEKAKKELRADFSPHDIVIIGDTIHDIRCAKAIGASVIAVTTGYHGAQAELAAEKPDFLVDSLTDPSVFTYFHI